VRKQIDGIARLNDKVGLQAPSRDAERENQKAQSLTSRIALLLICCAVGLHIWLAVRLYVTHRLSTPNDPALLQRAMRLEPRDANNYDLLGQYLIWEAQDPKAAATQFQLAVKLNPYMSSYWMHLAQAESSLGDNSEQAAAIRKAIAVDPTTPELAWSAANFFLIQGDTESALDQFAVVIRNDPAMAEAALERSWRAVGQVDPIQRRLPPDPEIYLSLIKLLVTRQQWAPAQQIWLAMLGLNRQFDARSAAFYVDALLAAQDVPAAQNVWQQIVEASTNLKPYIAPGNLVVNPGFNHEFLNGGFDWHYSGQNGVAIVLDPTETREGSEALLITYSGAPNGDAGISQPVPVTPGVAYIVSAWVKSEELETANGPQLSVFDGKSDQALARSDETLGSTGWHQVQATFTAPKEINLVVVRVSRDPASTRIQGKFWIDNVHMTQNTGETTPQVH
jgi:tetratricopeptide (TPR) repeat protein